MGKTSNYISYTAEEKHRANCVDLVSFLRSRGEKLLPSGRDKRLQSDHSITIRGNEWYDHATQEGGLAVPFVRRFYGLSFQDAMTMLLGNQSVQYQSADRSKEPERKQFCLPPAQSDMNTVYDYLTRVRGLDGKIVSVFALAGLLYEDARHHNAVFIGVDELDVPRHAQLRGTTGSIKQNAQGSEAQYSFHWKGRSDTMFVFESPIDMLSYITLYPDGWYQHSYVALCGTSPKALLWMLKQNTGIRSVRLCLDNDDAGIKAVDNLGKLLQEKGYAFECLLPDMKDWNEDLILKRGETPKNFV